MINLEDRIFRYFQESIEITMHIGEKFTQEIIDSVDIISTSLLSDGTIFTYGENEASIVSNFISTRLTTGCSIDRPPFKCLNINQTSSFNTQSRLLSSHSKKSDVLVTIFNKNMSENMSNLLKIANDSELSVISITAFENKNLSQLELYNKVTINLNGISKSALILAEIEISRCMCSLIEESIFGV